MLLKLKFCLAVNLNQLSFIDYHLSTIIYLLKEGKIFNIAPMGTASFFCF